MSANTTITLHRDASASRALGIARQALEHDGYLWVADSPDRAEAHENGRRVKHNAFTFRLRLGVEAGDHTLQLHRISNGIGIAGGTRNGYAMIRIRRNFRQATETVQAALVDAGLA
jgi:hypothetical protein